MGTRTGPVWRVTAIVAVGLLALCGLAAPFQRWAATDEGRPLAVPPPAPRGLEQALALPAALDALARDRFAFRDELSEAHEQLRRALGGRDRRDYVVEGRGGRLFLREGLARATGHETRAEVVADYPRFVCDLARTFAARDVRFVFGVAPGPASIETGALPAGTIRRSPTESERVLAGARACGAPVVDLRAALLAARADGPLYRRFDTHWTDRGAGAAANALVVGLGRPDWRISPERVRWVEGVSADSDLVRLRGRGGSLREPIERAELVGPSRHLTRAPLRGVEDSPLVPAYLGTTGRPGPTLLVIGDSYAAEYLPVWLTPALGRLAFVHHRACGFDWRAVEQVRPDYVILMPAERELGCQDGRRPVNRPAGPTPAA